MASAVYLPKVGMTMEEGVLARWIVVDGGAVAPGQAMFEMETEKVTMEIEAEISGVLRHLVREGAALKPGAVVGCVLAEGETEVPAEIARAAGMQASGEPQAAGAAPVATTIASVAEPASAPAAADATSAERVAASPAARRLAREMGVDIATVRGSGPGGRIVEADILSRADSATEDATAPSPAAAEPAAGEQRIAYEGRRRTIGERMLRSLQGSAQLTLTSEVEVDAALELLYGVNHEWRRERVVGTLTALVIRACGLALREQPVIAARLDGEAIVVPERFHVGFAVHHETGLMVPVVRDADRASLQEVCRAVAALSGRTRDDQLGVDDVSGGTFTVTSLEGFAVDAFTPVLNPPQTAILGVGRAREAAVVHNGRLEAGRVSTLSLTFDHRVVDGATAARFLTRVAALLGRPYMLM